MPRFSDFLEPENEDVPLENIMALYGLSEEQPFTWLLYLQMNPEFKKEDRDKICDIIRRLQAKLHRINQRNLEYLSRHEK